MESINLGAVLFAGLLLLWLVYALPRTASRREVMGRARAADEAEMSSQARDLSAAVHARRSSAEVTSPMSQDRLLMRPADPTRRPRFDAEPGTRVDLGEERGRSRRLMRTVLIGLIAATAVLVVAAVTQLLPWWTPLLTALALGVFLAGLRRAELDRRARRTRAATRARREQAEAETARRRATGAAPQPSTRVDLGEERGRSRRLMRTVLIGLIAATAVLVVAAVTQLLPWWTPLLTALALGVFLAGLRRAELDRRARRTRAATRARREQAEAETARRRATGAAPQPSTRELPAPSETASVTAPASSAASPAVTDLEAASERAAQQVTRPGEWTPRPVPRPTYALRGEVDDLASRHAAHRRTMLPESVPLESAHVEEAEAVEESFAPAQDLHLDEILARRRA